MSFIVNLPGGHAVIRDPATVTERQRRPVTRLQGRVVASPIGQLLRQHADKENPTEAEVEALGIAVMESGDAELLDELNDALIGALVESWSFEAPVSADGALDLPTAAYDALRVEVAKHVHELVPNLSEPSTDPKVSTPPSVD